MSPNGVGGKGGGLERGGSLLQKNDFQTGGLLERRGGGLTARWGLIEILQ